MKVDMEKYVKKALEGYEQNYAGITDAIAQIDAQREQYVTQQTEMREGITEMRELLGIEGVEDLELPSNLSLVSDEA